MATQDQAAELRQSEKKKNAEARAKAANDTFAAGQAKQQQAVNDFNALREGAKPTPTPEEVSKAKLGGIKPGDTSKEPDGTEAYSQQQQSPASAIQPNKTSVRAEHKVQEKK